MDNAFIDFVLSFDFVHSSLILLRQVAAISITLTKPFASGLQKIPKMRKLYSFDLSVVRF
jgi:hypothetical protein